MEDFKKNFILLSKVAKENKYAQEYLGLLARRGDIGSIRIGKRWYTTTEWFSEFLADAEIRKTEMKSAMAVSEPIEEKIEIKKESVAEEATLKAAPLEKIAERPEVIKFLEKIQEKPEKEEGKINLKIISPMEAKPIRKEEKITVTKDEEEKIILPRIIKTEPVVMKPLVLEKKNETVDLRKNVVAKPIYLKVAPGLPKIKRIIPEKEKQMPPVMGAAAVENWINEKESFSPNLVPDGSRMGFFPKFAFSMAVMLLLALIIEAGWVYKDDLKRLAGIRSGVVAGAEDSKIGLDTVRRSSASYMGIQEDRIRENISLSRVLIRAAMEKDK